MKNFSATAPKTLLDMTKSDAKSLILTHSQYIQSVLLKYLFENNHLSSINDEELSKLLTAIPRKGLSNFTGRFLDRVKNMSHEAQIAFLSFITTINLTPGLIVSSNECANFYKSATKDPENHLFYFAIIDFKGEPLDEYLDNLNSNSKINLFSIEGETTECKNNEYFYISKKQFFYYNTVVSEHFDDLLKLLSEQINKEIPSSVDVIKIHHSKLYNLANVLKTI